MAVTLPRTPLSFKFHLFIPVGVLFCFTIAGMRISVAAICGAVAFGLVVMMRTGLEFNSNHRFYREYCALGTWHIGQWRPLPTIIGITLKYYSEIGSAPDRPATDWGVWNNSPQRFEELVVMLSSGSANGIILRRFPLDDVNPAIDFAHDVAELFDVPVYMYLPPNQFQPLEPTGS